MFFYKTRVNFYMKTYQDAFSKSRGGGGVIKMKYGSTQVYTIIISLFGK